MPKNKDRNGGKQKGNKGVVKSLSRLARRKRAREASYADACRMAGRPKTETGRGHGPSLVPAE